MNNKKYDSRDAYFVMHLDIKEIEVDSPIQEELLAMQLQVKRDWFPSLSDASLEELVLLFPRSRESAKMFSEIAEKVKALVE